MPQHATSFPGAALGAPLRPIHHGCRLESQRMVARVPLTILWRARAERQTPWTSVSIRSQESLGDR